MGIFMGWTADPKTTRVRMSPDWRTQCSACATSRSGAAFATGSPAGRLGPLHGRRRRVPEGGRSKVNTPPVVSPEEWKTAREELLVKEKEHTRARDALAAERRRMPW